MFLVSSTANRRHLEDNAAAYAISRRLTAADIEQIEAISLANVDAPASTSRNGSNPGSKDAI